MSGIGSSALRCHRNGGRLTRAQAIHAKCAECCGDYQDGRFDCLIPACPLHPFMPYRGELEESVPVQVEGAPDNDSADAGCLDA